ncbi:hypothetical protein FB446DRAFT_756627 [Lentinula raphanica]|nr:hypothetical protein FB446DRAFT_756627 [Lentinula raphanica]
MQHVIRTDLDPHYSLESPRSCFSHFLLLCWSKKAFLYGRSELSLAIAIFVRIHLVLFRPRRTQQFPALLCSLRSTLPSFLSVMRLNPVFLGPCLALWLSFIACASSAPLPKPMEVIPANEVPTYTYTVKDSNDWFQKTFGSQIKKDAEKYNAKPKYEKDNSIPQFEFEITVEKHIPGKDGKGGIDVPTTKRMELRAKVADKGNKVFVALNPGPPKLGL